MGSNPKLLNRNNNDNNSNNSVWLKMGKWEMKIQTSAPRTPGFSLAKGGRHTGIERNTLRAGFDYFWVERREFGLLRLEAGSLAYMY